MGKKTEKSRKKSPRRKALELGIQIVLVLAVIWGIGVWQGRHLLSDDEPAPAFSLRSLEGSEISLGDIAGKKVVIYFFAPWCTVCNYASHNIVALREARTDDELAILAVGLGWESEDDLRRFAADHELNVPVLAGTDVVQRDYNITSFPTVYIIDEDGAVSDAVVGYTTELGLRLRSLM